MVLVHRATGLLVASTLILMAVAPLTQVTCVPGRECPMAGAPQALGSAAPVDRPTATAPDCCETTERHVEPGTVQASLPVQRPDSALVSTLDLVAPTVIPLPRGAVRDIRPAREVPLYALLSVLLI